MGAIAETHRSHGGSRSSSSSGGGGGGGSSSSRITLDAAPFARDSVHKSLTTPSDGRRMSHIVAIGGSTHKRTLTDRARKAPSDDRSEDAPPAVQSSLVSPTSERTSSSSGRTMRASAMHFRESILPALIGTKPQRPKPAPTPALSPVAVPLQKGNGTSPKMPSPDSTQAPLESILVPILPDERGKGKRCKRSLDYAAMNEGRTMWQRPSAAARAESPEFLRSPVMNKASFSDPGRKRSGSSPIAHRPRSSTLQSDSSASNTKAEAKLATESASVTVIHRPPFPPDHLEPFLHPYDAKDRILMSIIAALRDHLQRDEGKRSFEEASMSAKEISNVIVSQGWVILDAKTAQAVVSSHIRNHVRRSQQFEHSSVRESDRERSIGRDREAAEETDAEDSDFDHDVSDRASDHGSETSKRSSHCRKSRKTDQSTNSMKKLSRFCRPLLYKKPEFNKDGLRVYLSAAAASNTLAELNFANDRLARDQSSTRCLVPVARKRASSFGEGMREGTTAKIRIRLSHKRARSCFPEDVEEEVEVVDSDSEPDPAVSQPRPATRWLRRGKQMHSAKRDDMGNETHDVSKAWKDMIMQARDESREDDFHQAMLDVEEPEAPSELSSATNIVSAKGPHTPQQHAHINGRLSLDTTLVDAPGSPFAAGLRAMRLRDELLPDFVPYLEDTLQTKVSAEGLRETSVSSARTLLDEVESAAGFPHDPFRTEGKVIQKGENWMTAETLMKHLADIGEGNLTLALSQMSNEKLKDLVVTEQEDENISGCTDDVSYKLNDDSADAITDKTTAESSPWEDACPLSPPTPVDMAPDSLLFLDMPLEVQIFPKMPLRPTILVTVLDGEAVYLSSISSIKGRQTPLIRRIDNDFVNVTGLLAGAGVQTERDRAIALAYERNRHRYTGDCLIMQGTWIPLARARNLAESHGLPKSVLDIFLSEHLAALFPDSLQQARWILAANPSPVQTEAPVDFGNYQSSREPAHRGQEANLLKQVFQLLSHKTALEPPMSPSALEPPASDDGLQGLSNQGRNGRALHEHKKISRFLEEDQHRDATGRQEIFDSDSSGPFFPPFVAETVVGGLKDNYCPSTPSMIVGDLRFGQAETYLDLDATGS